MNLKPILDAYSALSAQMDQSSSDVLEIATVLKDGVKNKDPQAVACMKLVQDIAASHEAEHQKLAALWRELNAAIPTLPKYPEDGVNGVAIEQAQSPRLGLRSFFDGLMDGFDPKP
ncbi:hypothetical protein K6L44_16390 [Gluconacetobacter entanii]|uniref:Uncharacterized protein n=1 Tax=Gluconacetobacter entanii TaxID=108528 RepID=A0A318PXF1_9PROT|nr:hypothetical protein [Gluconacetobacter entanii]MBE7618832.1 hypothetical protein [Komagataeibacter sp. FXV2]MCE2580023.1 hypothetical protein [Komagataeibacter sp. FNDCR1]MBY4641531.1 hypothetical protein [Gluconacetobacter entanii]MCW4578938.1 hypothetical protein [Gluconacetobacter entanii]MCW4582339.1 hypothetical protein [Gluconacetobacter entanii]